MSDEAITWPKVCDCSYFDPISGDDTGTCECGHQLDEHDGDMFCLATVTP